MRYIDGFGINRIQVIRRNRCQTYATCDKGFFSLKPSHHQVAPLNTTLRHRDKSKILETLGSGA